MKKQEEGRLQRGQHILTFAKDKEAGWASRKPKEIHAQALHNQSLENQNLLEVVRSNTLREKAMLMIASPIRNRGDQRKHVLWRQETKTKNTPRISKNKGKVRQKEKSK